VGSDYSVHQGTPWQGGSDELKPCTASQWIQFLLTTNGAVQPASGSELLHGTRQTVVVERTQRVARRIKARTG